MKNKEAEYGKIPCPCGKGFITQEEQKEADKYVDSIRMKERSKWEQRIKAISKKNYVIPRKRRNLCRICQYAMMKRIGTPCDAPAPHGIPLIRFELLGKGVVYCSSFKPIEKYKNTKLQNYNLENLLEER